MLPLLGTALAQFLAEFGKDMVKEYLERKDDWDRIALEIEGKAKDAAIVALKYLADRGELTYKLKDDAGEIVPPTG